MSQPANDNFSLHDDEELSLHDDASLDGSVPASNKGDAPAKPPQIITTNTLSNIKLPVLQKDDYDTWAMEMEHYLEYIDNEVWKVIQNGNSKKRVTKGKDGVYRVLPPTTQEEEFADEKKRKARTLLLMAVPKDHLRRFHGMDDAKEIWAAIKTRFGGNANSKKMQKAVLKQQFEAFTISAKESLEKGYDRFQKLLSQLDALGAGVSDEDANHKFLRSLPPAWDSLAMTMRTKKNIDTLSIDDLYNNLSVFEQDIQKTSSSTLTADNVAFLSQAKASSSKHKPSQSSGSYSSYATSSSKATKTATPGLADEVIHSFLATNADDVDLIHEDLDQIDDLDLEEMDINWQIAMTALGCQFRLLKFLFVVLFVDFMFSLNEAFARPRVPHIAIHIFLCIWRLGHLNFKNLNKLVKDNLVRGLPSKSFKNDHTCVACQKGKQHKASCKAKIDRYVTHPLHTLHMDLFGPTSVRSINHASYCLVITDDCSRFCWVFFLAKKDETSGILKTFIRQIENQLNQKVKIIRSDNGTEFKNRVMLEFCGEKGIKQEFSNARTPQQNGVAERMNRTLIEAARTMLADSHLPTTFWAEAVNTACYTFNRVRVTKPQNKTPYELLFGHKPILSYIRPFGCHVTILNTLSPLGKFDEKSDEGFLVGYSVNSKAFRVYNLVTKRVEVNLHVNFLEEKPNVQGIGHRWMFDLDYLTDSMNYIPVSVHNQANPAGSKEVIDIDVQTEEAAELMVITSTSLTEATRKAAVSEEIATKKTHSPKQPSSTPISKSADDIMIFRKELDALALKHLGPVSATEPTSTNPVNTGSINLNTAFEKAPRPLLPSMLLVATNPIAGQEHAAQD
ncbi:putative ribonuclease H-like domain-containing protein [Tanacetum coccineum]